MKFRKYRHNLNPSRKFKKELWHELETKWQSEFKVDFYWYQTKVFRFAAVAVVAIIICSSFGTGAYAYSSPKVTEGTKLYAIKQKIERVEEKLKFTPTAKAKFYLKQINKREAEKRVLQKIKREVVSTNKRIDMAEKQLEKVAELINKKPIKNQALKNRVDNHLRQRRKFLERQKSILKNKEEKLKQIRQDLINKPTSSRKIYYKKIFDRIVSSSLPVVTTTRPTPIVIPPKPIRFYIEKPAISTTTKSAAGPNASTTNDVNNTTTPPKQILTTSEPAGSFSSDLSEQSVSSSATLLGPDSSTKTTSSVFVKSSFGSVRP